MTPTYCPVCDEPIHDPVSDSHVGCRNRPRPPVAPVWPAATRQDDPAVRSTVALNEARALLRLIGDRLDFLARESPNKDLPLASDHRLHRSALAWIGAVCHGLRELAEETDVARG